MRCLHTVVWILTSTAACGSGAAAPRAVPREPPPPPPARPPPTVELVEIQRSETGSGGPDGFASIAEPPEPPQLACEAGTAAELARPPDPTWYCARPDGTRHGPFVTLFPDGSIAIAGRYKDGALDGPWERHRETGTLAEIGDYAAGKKTGTWRMLGPSGALLGEYVMNAGTGIERWWLDDGTLYRERALKAGAPSGAERIYAADGTPLVVAQWVGGKLDGPHVVGTKLALRLEETLARGVRRGSRQIWLFQTPVVDESYDRRGKLDGEYAIWRSKKVMRAHGRYAHGKRDGVWTWNDRDGNPERIGSYADGKRDGQWTEWFDGKNVFTGNYTQGKPDGEFIYYDHSENELGRFEIKGGTGTMLTFWPNKKVASRQHLYQGVADGLYQELTKLGKVVVEGHYRNDLRHGAWKEWTPDGVPTLEQTWKRGKLDGVVRKYVDGKLATEATYKGGKASGKYVEYRSGKPAVTGQFTDDRKTGVWTTYDADGRVTLTATYKDGVLDGPWRQLVGGVVLEGTLTQGRRTGTWTQTDKAGAVRQQSYAAGSSLR